MRKLGITLFFMILILMLFGSIMVLTASSTYAQTKFNNSYFYFYSHIQKVLIAFVALVLFSAIDYEYYKYYSKLMLFGGVVLLIATLIFAPSVKGAERWINIGGLRLQPTEIVKIVLFIHLANMVDKKGDLITDFKNGYVYTLVWILLVAALIVLQPNLSNATIIIFVSLIVLYNAGARLKHILSTLLTLGILGFSIMLIMPHSRARILAYITGISEKKAGNIQLYQALVGIGSGGITGLGLGNSRQNNLFLPEPFGDFIFAIIGEELGFIGGVILVLYYFAIFFVMILIAKKTEDKFGRLIVLSFAFLLIMSAYVNISVAIGIVPTTGIPLPFVSYGGTSMIFLSIAIGIVINIAFSNERKFSQKILVNLEN
jgi:cell division protein FtsW